VKSREIRAGVLVVAGAWVTSFGCSPSEVIVQVDKPDAATGGTAAGPGDGGTGDAPAGRRGADAEGASVADGSSGTGGMNAIGGGSGGTTGTVGSGGSVAVDGTEGGADSGPRAGSDAEPPVCVFDDNDVSAFDEGCVFTE
jgi:hypothetical protein